MHYLEQELRTLLKNDSSIFDFLQNGPLDGIWYWDLEKPEHKWLSPGFWRTLGYDPQDKMHLAAEWQNCIDPQDLKVVLENFNKHCAEPQHPLDQEVRYTHKDGSIVWVRCRGIAIRDKNGKPVRMLGTQNDLTQHKQAEQQIRKAEETFRLAMEASRDGVWDWDIAGNQVYYSPGWAAILDEKSVPSQFSTWETRLHPDDKAIVRGTLTEHLAGKTRHWELEHRLRIKDGSWKWVLGRGQVTARDETGRALRMVGTMTDISRRKLSQLALSKSKALYHSILKTSMDGFWVTDSNGRLLEVNDAYCRMSGYNESELIGKHLLDLAADANKALVFEHTQKIMAQTLHRFESRHRRKDGTCFDVEVSIYYRPVEDRYISFIRDISQRKERASEKEMTLNLLAALHRENDLRGLLKDITGQMQTWSGCQAVGVRLKEGVDFPYFETRGFPAAFVEAEKRLCVLGEKGEIMRDSTGDPILECMCGNVISGRIDPAQPCFTPYGSFWTNSTTDLLAGAGDLKASLRNRCNSQGYESVALIPLKVGHQRLGLLQFNDPARDRFNVRQIKVFERLAANLAMGISQRVTAAALQESAANYSAILEAMEDPTYICSPDLRMTYMNPAMVKWLGRDAVGQVCHKVLHGRDDKCDDCVFEQVLLGEHVVEEKYFPRQDRTFNVSNTPMRHTGGSVSKLTVFRDVTDLKNMEKHIQQAQRMEAIGALAGGIAHDFNNLLFPISGLAEMLMMDTPADSMEHQNAREIFKAAQRAGDLVRQILAFSRQGDPQRTAVRLQSILKEVAQLSRAMIPANIDLAFDLQHDCGLVMVDPSQIHQIAMNLITNAYHAVEESGGKIFVRLAEETVTAADSADIQLEPGKYARMTVSDTGFGIPDTIIDKIFQPYFTTKTQGKGTGLGLSVVYGIVKTYGGQIRVTSEAGKGASFDIYLPLKDQADEAPQPQVDFIDSVGTERILLVDDDEFVASLEKQMLERLGYRVDEHYSSLEALKTFRSDPDAYDLVISDMTMPNMTGDQLAEELMALKPGLPMIICTGFSERLNQEKVNSLGIKGILLKPIIRADLARMVRAALDEAKP